MRSAGKISYRGVIIKKASGEESDYDNSDGRSATREKGEENEGEAGPRISPAAERGSG